MNAHRWFVWKVGVAMFHVFCACFCVSCVKNEKVDAGCSEKHCFPAKWGTTRALLLPARNLHIRS